MKVPSSAAYASTAAAQNSRGSSEAYIINPVCGVELLTPAEALGAISTLSAMLVADGKFREVLNARVTP